MNFFIDFEATQFSEEIISVGCMTGAVNGFKAKFSSLVKPEGKITPFITNLTGITPEMIAEAPSVDEVFSKMYDWYISLNVNEEKPTFWVYGNSDITFVQHTLKKAKTMKANAMLCLLLGNIEDYAVILRKQLGLYNDIGLYKVLNAFNADVRKEHDALEDAWALMQVHTYAKGETKYLKDTLDPKYFAPPERKQNTETLQINRDDYYIVMGKKKKIEFEDLKTATEYVMKNLINPASIDCNPNNVAKKIWSAANQKKKYCNRVWSLRKKKGVK